MDDHSDARQLKLGHRHLAFFFIGAVAICAIFFALGFVVGRGQTHEAAMKEQSSGAKTLDPNSSVNSSLLDEPMDNVRLTNENSERPQTRRDQDKDYRAELDFYNSLDRQNVDENFHAANLNKEKKLASVQNLKTKSASSPRTGFREPSVSLVSLQVGAFSNASDADKLAKVLRAKGYSVSLLSPSMSSVDKLFRIHVGPFTHPEEANKVKNQLQRDGYEAIVKH